MARTFIDVDQGDYVSLGGTLGAYGIHKNLYVHLKDVGEMSADELNNEVPMIHFNRYHQNEDGVPSGQARVLQVKWAKPVASGRGKQPYVRLRELPFGMVGDTLTERKRYTALEVFEYIKNHHM